ncbi:MAG: hypothetical protein IT374_21870, partial [Polyangiaceae bacterium]|nr:hypothetical protein [Polyangiaceae bacterium]
MALGVAYAPTLTVAKASGFPSVRWMNYAGVEVAVDFLDRPMRSRGRSSYGKVFTTLLPPVGGLSMGFGIPSSRAPDSLRLSAALGEPVLDVARPRLRAVSAQSGSN